MVTNFIKDVSETPTTIFLMFDVSYDLLHRGFIGLILQPTGKWQFSVGTSWWIYGENIDFPLLMSQNT